MLMKFNGNQKNNRNEVKINFNDISTLLYKTGFLENEIIDTDILSLLSMENKINLIDIFEFNNSITIKEASAKYNDLMKSLKQILKFEFKINLESLYHLYLEYTENKISLTNFLNILIMMNYILTTFKQILKLSDNSDLINVFQLNKKISIISLDNINVNDKESLSYKLEKLYEKIEQNKESKGDKGYNYLIILIYILSLDGNIIVDNEASNLLNLLQKYNLYNKIYISNIHLSLVLYIQMEILVNIYLNPPKPKKLPLINNKYQFQELSLNEQTRNSNNFTFTRNNNVAKFNYKTQLLSSNRKLNHHLSSNKLSENELKNNIYINELPNYYIFDDEINSKIENTDMKIILFQNYLKCFSFYTLSKNKIQIDINLSIESISELIEINNKNESNKQIFTDINENIINELNLDQVDLLIKENFRQIFSCFNINDLIIKFTDFKNKAQVEIESFKYIDLIANSNTCYLQEPVDSFFINRRAKKDKSNKNFDSLTIKELFTQFDILCFYLIFFLKNHEIKKSPKSIIIKFNVFKCIINRENKKIQIFFNFSFVKEKTLFHYLKHISNILNLLEKYTDVILILKEFKQYDSTIRLFQNNFRSHQTSFIFTLLTRLIVNFVDENKLAHRIIILETKFNNYNPNLQVYIKDENTKLKNRIIAIKQMIFQQQYGNKFYVLLNYLEDLTEIWNLIVISDNENDFKLLRTFDDNKLFFFLSFDKTNVSQSSQENTTQINSNMDNINENKKKNNIGVEYVNVILYFKNDENIFNKGLSFIEDLASDKDSVLEYKFTLICDRFFLETNILMEPSMKKYVKIMYSLIDNIFMIAKNIKNENDIIENDENEQDNEYYNYDIFIADSFIAVANYHIYNIEEDKNYSKIIFEFLSILSSCIEVILYILKNKDIYIPKFIYLIRTVKDNYYMFEYKESNMFIKKVKEFTSLISLHTKECYPLFCFLSQKTQTKYTISNDNFYDVFLRLFLNLNKVVEPKEKLNEIFLHKIHKNIFYEYYDSFLLIAFSFEALNFFNDFLMKNEYLTITEGDKFDKCYIILTEDISNRKNNYELLLKNLQDESKIIVKKTIVFDFNFKPSYFFLNKKYSNMGFRKAEYLINEEIKHVKYKIIPDLRINLNSIYKIFEKKTNSKESKNKIVERIKLFMVGNQKITIYNSISKVFENILEEYIKEKNKMKAQKVEMRVYQLTEEANNIQNSLQNSKKDCNIF